VCATSASLKVISSTEASRGSSIPVQVSLTPLRPLVGGLSFFNSGVAASRSRSSSSWRSCCN
jgi:hypothetical protein